MVGPYGIRIRSWFVSAPRTREIKLPVAPLEARLMAGNNAAVDPRGSAGFNGNKRIRSSAQVDIGAAAGLIVVGAIAYRLRQPLQEVVATTRPARLGPASARSSDSVRGHIPSRPALGRRPALERHTPRGKENTGIARRRVHGPSRFHCPSTPRVATVSDDGPRTSRQPTTTRHTRSWRRIRKGPRAL